MEIHKIMHVSTAQLGVHFSRTFIFVREQLMTKVTGEMLIIKNLQLYTSTNNQRIFEFCNVCSPNVELKETGKQMCQQNYANNSIYT